MRSVQSILFLLGVAVLVLAPGLALLAQTSDSPQWDALRRNRLVGAVINAKTPALDAQSFWDGQGQSGIEPWLAERMGAPREFLIRVNNMFDYWAGRTKVPGLLIGRDGYLFGPPMLTDWCLRRDPGLSAEMAIGLKRAQQKLESLGKTFVYVMSPNKAAIYPEYAPGYCKPSTTPRFHDRFAEELTRNGVNFVNAHALLDAEPKTPIMFGKYGGHWNDIGQFYTVRTLLALLEAKGGRAIGQLELRDVRTDRKPRWDEADAGALLNLPYELAAESPHARFGIAARGKPINAIFIGSSFMWGPMRLLSEQGLIGNARLYYYFNSTYRYTGTSEQQVHVPNVVREDFGKALLDVDYVILESNDEWLESPHVTNFIKAVDSL
jgi:alginate O-acetyltransferase complex protein AlgJ